MAPPLKTDGSPRTQRRREQARLRQASSRKARPARAEKQATMDPATLVKALDGVDPQVLLIALSKLQADEIKETYSFAFQELTLQAEQSRETKQAELDHRLDHQKKEDDLKIRQSASKAKWENRVQFHTSAKKANVSPETLARWQQDGLDNLYVEDIVPSTPMTRQEDSASFIHVKVPATAPPTSVLRRKPLFDTVGEDEDDL